MHARLSLYFRPLCARPLCSPLPPMPTWAPSSKVNHGSGLPTLLCRSALWRQLRLQAAQRRRQRSAPCQLHALLQHRGIMRVWSSVAPCRSDHESPVFLRGASGAHSPLSFADTIRKQAFVAAKSKMVWHQGKRVTAKRPQLQPEPEPPMPPPVENLLSPEAWGALADYLEVNEDGLAAEPVPCACKAAAQIRTPRVKMVPIPVQHPRSSKAPPAAAPRANRAAAQAAAQQQQQQRRTAHRAAVRQALPDNNAPFHVFLRTSTRTSPLITSRSAIGAS